jgi:hypothetical protein
MRAELRTVVQWLLLAYAGYTTTAMAQTYLDLGIGRIEGDYDTGVNSSVDSFTARYGYFGTQYFANASLSLLHLDTEGLGSQTGLGDVVLQAGYIYRHPNNSLTVLPSLTIKLPSADENDGLGSGETDVGFFVDAVQRCGDISCSASIGYVVLGDPPGIDYENQAQINLGAVFTFQRSAINTYLQYQTALVKGFSDPISLGVNGFYILDLESTFYVDGLIGVNDSAPDYGLRTGIINWF